jgi:hypothetical protein
LAFTIKSRNAFNILVEKLEGRGEFGRSRRRCEDNIKIVLKEIGHGMDLSGLGQGNALVNTVIKFFCSLKGDEFFE